MPPFERNVLSYAEPGSKDGRKIGEIYFSV
jgi:hypothetical protein